MRSIVENSIEKVEILNGEGERVAVIEIDTADGTLPERFSKMMSNLDSLSEVFGKESKEFNEKYAGRDENDEVDINMLTDFSMMRINNISKLINEINLVFGEGTVEKYCADHYRLNPDYVPDEVQLIDMVNALMPIVNELFGQRFERIRKDYNPAKKGATKKRRHYG